MKALKYLWKIFLAFPRWVASYFFATQVSGLAWTLLAGWAARGQLNRLAGVAEGALSFEATLGALLLAFTLTMAGQAAKMYFSIAVTRHAMAMLALNIVERLVRRPGALPLPDDPTKGRPLSEGQCLSTLGRDAAQLPNLFSWLFDVAAMFVSGAIALGVMLSIDAMVTLLVVAPLGLVFIVVNLLAKRVEPLSEKARRSAGEVSSILSDMFNNVQTIKTSAAAGRVIGEFRRRNAKRLSDAMRSEVFFTLLRGLNSGLIQVATSLVLLAGAGAIRAGAFTAGDFVLFSAYLQAILGVFRWSGSLVAELKRHGVSIGRMEALMAPEGEFAPARKRKLGLAKVPEFALELGPDGREPLRKLEVRGLSYRYPRRRDEDERREDGRGAAAPAAGAFPAEAGPGAAATAEAPAGHPPFALEDVDFELEGGTLTVVTGPVGCGKSTLLRCVLGLLPATGTVFWNGVEAPRGTELERSAFWKAPRCAYTPQVPRLFSDSIEGNILLGVPRGRVDLEALAAAACLEPDLAEMPERFDTQIGPRGVRLSGGQVQRVAAARMFARGASLNVLDDISSALDVVTEQKLWDRLATGDPERTWLVASHREALFKRADLILLMDSGRIVARGTFGELSASSPLFRELLRRETAAAEG